MFGFRALFLHLLARQVPRAACGVLRFTGQPLGGTVGPQLRISDDSAETLDQCAYRRLDDYLARLDASDIEDGATTSGARTKNLAEKNEALRKKRGRYEAMLAQLDRTDEDQISLTDPDGFVTPTIADVSFVGKMADGNLVRSPPISA